MEFLDPGPSHLDAWQRHERIAIHVFFTGWRDVTKNMGEVGAWIRAGVRLMQRDQDCQANRGR